MMVGIEGDGQSSKLHVSLLLILSCQYSYRRKRDSVHNAGISLQQCTMMLIFECIPPSYKVLGVEISQESFYSAPVDFLQHL